MSSYFTKKDIAKDSLLRAIRAGRYRPGQALRQNDIARDLGLSSTPVREALTDLAASGLVVYEQHRGVRVADVGPERVRQVYSARKLIEREAARLAVPAVDAATLRRLRDLLADMAECRRRGDQEKLMAADEAFHLTILGAGGNPFLVDAVRQLWDAFPRYFIWLSEARMAQSMDEHAHMLDALEAGDEAAVLAAVDAHLDHFLDAVLGYLAAHADEATGDNHET